MQRERERVRGKRRGGWSSSEASGSNSDWSVQDGENGFRLLLQAPTHCLFSPAHDLTHHMCNQHMKHLFCWLRRSLLTAENICRLPRTRPLARAPSQSQIHLLAAHRKLIKCEEILCFQETQLGCSKSISHAEKSTICPKKHHCQFWGK